MLGFVNHIYNGGATCWGQMIGRCTECGELISCWDCDADGVPIAEVFDEEEKHNCLED